MLEGIVCLGSHISSHVAGAEVSKGTPRLAPTLALVLDAERPWFVDLGVVMLCFWDEEDVRFSRRGEVCEEAASYTPLTLPTIVRVVLR